MFACQSSFDGGLRMPKIGCTDYNGINIFVQEHFLVIVVHFSVDVIILTGFLFVVIFNQLFTVGQTVLIQIAHGNHPGHIVLHGSGHVVIAGNTAAANLTDVNFITWRIFAHHTRWNNVR